MTLPTGTVTFLFTDVEGSTRLWESAPEPMRVALARLDALASALFANGGGVWVKPRGEGDSLFCVFARATDALAVALELQRALAAEPWPPEAVLRVRMALDTGEADVRDGDYYGPIVNRCVRLRGLAQGGQVLLSEATRGLVRDRLPAGAGLHDRGTHRLRDVSRPERVFQLVHSDLAPPPETPPRPLSGGVRNNLPRLLTTFVGRQKEVGEVRRLLTTAPLVTLTGSGGCGKTRLSLQAAAGVEGCPDGIWFADLAPLAASDDPAGAAAAQVVARAAGIGEEPGRPLIQTLADALNPQSLLVILDNCEHVLGEVAPLAQALLRACPRLRILATSREGLGVDGETTFRVPSLGIPAGGTGRVGSEQRSVPALLEYDAVRLFAERAAAADPDFVVTETNAAAVAEICARLDGIPLALELAAARVRTFSVEQIAVRLSDRFRLLSGSGGNRTAFPRHQTLRALIDWSFDLLEREERSLLARLSVFAGGFTLEAAQSVGGNGDADAGDRLARLVEKSMVVFDAQDGAGRYRLLEIIRQYASERLDEGGEAATIRERHRHFFLLWGASDPPPSLLEYETEHDNLRAALDGFRDDPTGGEAGLRLAAALWAFWKVRGHLREGRERYALVLAHPGAQETTSARASALNAVGSLVWTMGENDAATEYFTQALKLFRDLGRNDGVARTLSNLANVLSDGGELNRAAVLFREALSIERKLGLISGMSITLYNLADVAIRRGEWKRARRLLAESARYHNRLGGGARLRYVLWGMGRVAVGENDLPAARLHFSESLVLCRDFGDRGNTAALLLELANVTLRQGRAAKAARLWGASSALSDALGAADYGDTRRSVEEALREALGPPEFERARAEGAALPWEEAVDEALETTRVG